MYSILFTMPQRQGSYAGCIHYSNGMGLMQAAFIIQTARVLCRLHSLFKWQGFYAGCIHYSNGKGPNAGCIHYSNGKGPMQAAFIIQTARVLCRLHSLFKYN